MTRYRIAAICSALVGVLVMIGWLRGIDGLTRVLPGAVTQKPTTALCGLTSGAMLLCMTWKSEAVRNLAVGFMFVLWAVLCLVIVGTVTSIETGFDRLIVAESLESSVFSSAPGAPSHATIVAYALVGLFGVFHVFNGDHRIIKHRTMRSIGLAVFVVGAIAMLGYITIGLCQWLQWPEPLWMVYYIEGQSSAMAIHTAAVVCVQGAIMATCPFYGVQSRQ